MFTWWRLDNMEAILPCPSSWWWWSCLLEWWPQSSSSSGKPGAGGKQSCPDLGQMCGNSVELKSFLRLLHTHVALILAYDPCPAVLGRPSNRSHFEATKTVIEQYRTSPKRTKTLLQSWARPEATWFPYWREFASLLFQGPYPHLHHDMKVRVCILKKVEYVWAIWPQSC